MAISPETIVLGISAKDIIVSLTTAAVIFVVEKLYGDFWYELTFLKPKYRLRLTGSGFRVFELKGVMRKEGLDTTLDLVKNFPRPSGIDGVEYAISNATLSIKRNHDALLKAVLTWTANGKTWMGDVKGRGRFFPTAPDTFRGHVYLVCDCEATSEKSTKDTWKVTYVLRTKPGNDGLQGYWLMVDTYDPSQAKFGQLDLLFA